MKSLIPRTPPGKPKSSKALPLKSKYNGPVYLPKHVEKELDKYNKKEGSIQAYTSQNGQGPQARS